MEVDILDTEDPKKLYTTNQKTKVFGPVMLPPLKENSETTSSTGVVEPHSSDEEKEVERKRNRNKRRTEQRNRKVTVAYYYYSLGYF